MARWTQDREVPKLRYQSSLDPKDRGWHYLWEAAGFGVQVFKNGKCTWVQCGSRKDTQSGKWKSYFYALGDVASVKLADARAEAGRVKADAKQSIDVRVLPDAEQTEQKAEATLAATPLRDVLEYYLDNRNCAPSSKTTLASILGKHLADWMSLPILDIDATMLQVRYKKTMAKVAADGVARAKRYRRLSAADRLVHSSDGCFTGVKTAHDIVEEFGRIYRYWITKHLIKLQRAGVLVPACPTAALIDDLIPQPQRVKSVPIADLRKLIESFSDYEGDALHPLLVRLLLASGLRVGVTMGCKIEYIKTDRIVIPAHAERSKVKWKKRHLEHMTYIVPITPEISGILDLIARVAPIYGDAKTWLFPSRTSKSGHMQEERSATVRLRKHALVRFTMHQLRHNVATAGEEVGFRKSEIAELLGHTTSNVTDRYIDQRVKRHRELLVAINEYLSHAILELPAQVNSVSPSTKRLNESRATAPTIADVMTRR